MSRTTHHTPWARRPAARPFTGGSHRDAGCPCPEYRPGVRPFRPGCNCVPGDGPAGVSAALTWNRVRDLRYSAAELAAAEAEGRRPAPEHVVREFASFRYSRAFRDPDLGRVVNRAERTARAAARVALAGWCDAVNSADFDPDDADDWDVPDYRPRNSARARW